MPVASGTRFGKYEIRRPLGAGGMGEVYLAQDTRLRRPVALKLLLAKYTGDEERLRRFEQEACAASALNHQNIITVYDIDTHGDAHFIAAEYVEGDTLRDHLSRRRPRLREALDIATQVADALSAAHKEGIVHRDIKPENIMLRPDGRVKVLDFGLAKLTEKRPASGDADLEAATQALVNTNPGAVMGTVSYMSPEQARGLAVDERTDLWSLGCVLYEMIAGCTPFHAPTASDQIAHILGREPQKLALFSPEATGEVELVIEKALAKDADERYQTAKDFLNDLRRVRRHLDVDAESERPAPAELRGGVGANPSGTQGGGAAIAAATTAPGSAARTSGVEGAPTVSSAEFVLGRLRRHKLGVTLALAALVAAAGGGYALYRYLDRGRSAAPIFQNFTVSRVTTSGRALEANISPDGKYIVYLEMGDDGSRGLSVKQTATGNTIPIVPPTKGNVLKNTSFSPDGNFVYYYFSDRTKRGSLYQVSSVGGTPKKIIDVCDSTAAVSPDGRKIAFMRYEDQGKSTIFVANADGTGERALASLDGDGWFSEAGPAWSPDGKTMAIAASVMTDGVEGMRLLGVDAETGATRELSPKRWVEAGRVVWMPDGAALVLMATERADEWAAQVWRVAYPAGEASRVTNDVQGRDETSLGVTADGRTLLTVTQQRLSRIETIPAGGDTSRPTRLTTAEANQEGLYGFGWAPGGRVVFSSLEGGQPDLWVMNADGGGRRRLTSDTFFDGHPAVSPDGRYVVFRTNRPDGAPFTRLWRMDIDGGNLVQLAAKVDFPPHISPDGRWVVYDYWSSSEGRTSLWKVSIDGGEPVRLTDFSAHLPSYSPDGRWIGCFFLDEQVTPSKTRYGIIPADGGRPVRQFDFPGYQYQWVQWTPDGRHLSHIGAPPDPSNIWLQPAEGGQPRQLTDFKTDYIYRHAWSRDGKTLALARGRPMFDVVLMRDSR